MGGGGQESLVGGSWGGGGCPPAPPLATALNLTIFREMFIIIMNIMSGKIDIFRQLDILEIDKLTYWK